MHSAETQRLESLYQRTVRHADILPLHKILAGEVMDQGEAGKYRLIAVRVGQYLLPLPDAVSGFKLSRPGAWRN